MSDKESKKAMADKSRNQPDQPSIMTDADATPFDWWLLAELREALFNPKILSDANSTRRDP
ncbi:MAG TPA: hypothetical protein VGM30_14910 [Puia sp.]|jgi:hypothetical protein